MADVPDRGEHPARKMGDYTTPHSGQEVLEGMMSSMDIKMIQDPLTGTVHADLSDPEHPFWKGMN